jgi:cation:H+ antiporter
MPWSPYLLAGGMSLPWAVCTLFGVHPSAPVVAVLTGVSVLGAAFLLSWACEAAEMDVPRAFAVSVLALVAVLPEYAVDATFAWKAARDPTQASYAIANMTGGNRLLLGLGWPLVVGLGFLRFRKREIDIPRDMGVEVSVLLLATLYAAVPIVRGALTVFDTVVYVLMYVVYLVAAARGESQEVELVGPARAMADLTPPRRRLGVVALFVYAAVSIGIAAEPFAESLVQTGSAFGIDEFLLVQWVAPLASESPEVVVAILMVFRGSASTGLRTLVSSKVNQWTLLVGTLALVYSVSFGSVAPMPIDARQRDELLLTAAQSLFGVAVLADLRFTLGQGALLATLFLGQVIFADAHFQVGVGYVALSVGLLAFSPRTRKGFAGCFRTFARMLAGGASG